MGVFTDDMARLSEEIAAGRASRKDMLHSLKGSIATLRTDVGEMLTKFGNKRAEIKQQMQSELSELTPRLQRFSKDLGEQVIDMRKGFHQERTQMLERMNGGLEHFMASLKDEVAQMQTRFKRQRAESSSQIREEMDVFLGQLKAFTQNLEKEVGDMQAQFGRERIHMKQHMNAELQSFISRLKAFAAGLDDEVFQMRKGFHQARSEMIARLQLELGGFTNGLRASVGSMLEKYQSDRQGGRAAWTGKGHDAPQPKAFTKSQKNFEQNTDDLTRIPGIGSHRQAMLNQAGIHTFTQLASTTPEQLAKILGKKGGPAKFEAWITHAESMAR